MKEYMKEYWKEYNRIKKNSLWIAKENKEKCEEFGDNMKMCWVVYGWYSNTLVVPGWAVHCKERSYG